MPGELRLTNEHSFQRYCFLAAWILLISLVVILWLPGTLVFTIFFGLVQPLIAVLSSIWLFQAARPAVAGGTKRAWAWGLLGFGILSIGLGDLLWSFYEEVLHVAPFPSPADILYLLYYPLSMVGIFLLTSLRFSKTQWGEKVLDAGTVTVSSVLLFWNFVIGPIIAVQPPEAGILELILSLAYPIGDLLLIWALFALTHWNRQNQDYRGLFILGLGIIMMVIADISFSIQALKGTYQTGNLVDLGYITSYLLGGLAGVYQFLHPVLHDTDPTPGIDQALPFSWDRIKIHTSSIFIIGAFGLLVYSYFRPLPMGFPSIALAVGGIFIMVLIRQMATSLENKKLVKDLELALVLVQEQARTLDQTNKDLLAEMEERQRTERQLAFEELHDHLTGLPNRVQMVDQIERVISGQSPQRITAYALLMIDLDDFKVKNESLGHALGDRLLVAVTERVRGCLRSSDIVGRMGGDEFAILIDNAGDEQTPLMVANRIMSMLRRPFPLDDNNIVTSASIGIVLDMNGYQSAQDLLRDVDIAVYQAKAQGKGRCEVFHSHMLAKAVNRMQTENEIRLAVELEELRLVYQPIFRLDTLEIVGMEALVRWQHPRRGLLSPGEFIPIAEETGLINDIGEWVLEHACSQLSRWRQTLPGCANLSVSVNISGRQFSKTDFHDRVRRVLENTRLPGEALHLEITEGIFINNPSLVMGFFKRLRSLGVQLYIDDFQTGYSSVSFLLNDFPVQCIKIDRSFVNLLGQSKKKAEVVSILISQARTLGMTAIAEGVETNRELSELQRLGCPFGQGYLLARPMEPGAIEQFLLKEKVFAPEN